MRQALFLKLLTKEIEQFGVLKLTPAGHKYIKKPFEVYVTCDHDYSNPSSEDDEEATLTGSGAAAGDEALYTQLKSLLKSIAQHQKLPLHVIFEDRSIKDMTIQ